ncbi:cysteine-rich RECEPTOR-like kinase [Rhynchospora pubera]|uniref:Cysteine-rich RECEPTOR-like kinase n=1 Tax=Rhynchospora pubera TaxID=906938 RepID=A0AAV8FQH2_9POAL|nr:cysteine-rich RECEPTOR-like kinase [Rhynchospora pubera]
MKYPHLLLAFFSIFLLALLHSPNVNADTMLYYVCSSTNYTANTTYDFNLRTLLTNLRTGATNSTTNFGFSKSIVGSNASEIFGVMLCRGDVNNSDCYSCLSQATQDIQNLCPYKKASTIYYDSCLLRLSNKNFLSSTNDSTKYYLRNNLNITGSQTLFDSYVQYLLTATANFAAFSSSKKFGTAQLNQSVAFPELNQSHIYGLAQCTPDMSDSDCASCLNGQIGELQESIGGPPKDWFSGKIGGRILSFRCNIRYEIFSFYGGATFLSLTAPTQNAPTPAPSPAPVTTLTPPETNLGDEGRKKTSTRTILAITIPLVLALVLLSGLCACFVKKKKRALTKPLLHLGNPEEITSAESLLFDFSVLRVATTDFAEQNKLGEGGFGAVYKGILPDGREIAVKRLSERSGNGLGELKNELLLVAKLQHRNLVRLLGVCLEDQEKLLVYEYVPNKSLDQILFDAEKRHLLDWGRRYKIICGVARGLLYLHEESQLKIIHRDLTASNVLLDTEMNPKISDFGLARLFGRDQTQEFTSRIAGTYGYMSPEYATHGQFSIKSDVFSYGVLVLEIITGKKNSNPLENEEIEHLLSFVWDHWTTGAITEVADPFLGQNYPMDEMLKCIQIGLLCVQDNPAHRPTMSNVAVMLSAETMSLDTPSKPAYCIERNSIPIRAGSNFSNVDGIISGNIDKHLMSRNELSITDIEPR